MDEKINFRLIFIAMLLAGLCILPKISSADTFDLSYSLVEGGYNLKLDTDDSYKGVQIEVATDIATRYEILQKVTRRLENRGNPQSAMNENFVVRSIRQSQKGTLHIPSSDVLVRANERVYTSNANGDPDNFTLVYGMADITDLPAGYYQSQIAFTLRAIGSSRQEIKKYLDVYITISQEKKASVVFSTASGSKSIMLDPKKDDKKVVDVLVTMNGSFKKNFSIVQTMPQRLESSEGNWLSQDLVLVETGKIKKGIGIPRTPLTSQPQTIYASTPSGQADESFVITYSLGDLSQYKAGRYRGFLDFNLDEMSGQTKLERFALEVENEKVFDLVVTPQDQKGVLEFRGLKPKDPPKQNEVIIEIRNNTGKQYQVSQNVPNELINKDGKAISSQYFTLRTESMNTKGLLKALEKTGVPKGENILFVSDPQGSSDTFKVIYELSCPQDASAGDYSASISYSLVEI